MKLGTLGPVMIAILVGWVFGWVHHDATRRETTRRETSVPLSWPKDCPKHSVAFNDFNRCNEGNAYACRRTHLISQECRERLLYDLTSGIKSPMGVER